MKKYSKIVVLSAGINQNNQGSRRFNNGKESFSYETLADPYEFRFKAVKKLFSDGSCSDFILVGGEVQTKQNGKKSKFIGNDGKTVSKTEVMGHCLINNYQIPVKNLTTLKSASNTEGNAKATAQYLKEKNIKDFETIGILTSFYHLPRAIKIFKEAGLSFIPICAEGVIYDEEFDLIKKFYKNEGFSIILGDIKNIDSEIKGMGDREKDAYIPRLK